MRAFIPLALLSALPATGQLAPFNSAGVTIGHIHLNVRDMAAHEHFWLALGGTAFPSENMLPQKMIQFPGVYILLREQISSGGSAGSVIDHIGFNVKHLAEWLPKWRAGGLSMQKGKTAGHVMLLAPDDIRVEMVEDPSVSEAVTFEQIHLYVPNPRAAQAWYVKVFGAMADDKPRDSSGNTLTAKVLGAEFRFTKSDATLAPSKGRALDHIGFDANNLDAFVKRLASLGLLTEYPVRGSTKNPNGRVTHITDPWGMRIELSEGTPRIIRSALDRRALGNGAVN